MRVISRVVVLAAGLLATSAFAPAPMAAQLELTRASVAGADPICDEYFRCVAQCPTEDADVWQACNQGCFDLYPCILGE